jgi:hypothetical protein
MVDMLFDGGTWYPETGISLGPDYIHHMKRV